MNGMMMLDYKGDLPAPHDVQIVESEVDFLRLATSGQPLLIRGERLCTWAHEFCTLRDIPTRYVESSSSILKRIFPVLSNEQLKELSEKIGGEMLALEDCSPAFILSKCFPEEDDLWHGKPSLQHAARWLLWLMDHSPSESENIVLCEFAKSFSSQCFKEEVGSIYQAVSREQAKSQLWHWLGLENDYSAELGEFPVDLTSQVLNQVKQEWQKRIINNFKNGRNFFVDMLSFPLPLSLRQELALQTAEFFYHQPKYLTRDALRYLRPYLNNHQVGKLEESLPPPEPSPMPDDESEVISWIKNEYFPYRRWQVLYGDETSDRTAVKCAQNFAHWFLEHYPIWLIEGQRLSFQKAAHLPDNSLDKITLCLIFDGLPIWDAEDLVQSVSRNVPRLTLLDQDYSFASIPTITEFAKDSLIKGLPPVLSFQSKNYLGIVIPENSSPLRIIHEAQMGDVIFWRLEQPDKAYHFENKDKRDRKVRAEIETVIKSIEEIVQSVPDYVSFQIIITTDHGRLYKPQATRCLESPPGAKVHGRVAWGKFERSFPECGYEINVHEKWVDLFGERFGVSENLRIAWDEHSFKNVKGGREAYPHGGLFPEEVLIPWFVFARDAKPVLPEVTVIGKGEAEASGELEISVINCSKLELECLQIELSNGARKNVNWIIGKLDSGDFKTDISPWPKKSDLDKIQLTLKFRQPNGLLFSCETKANLEVQTLYDRDDTILKELDL